MNMYIMAPTDTLLQYQGSVRVFPPTVLSSRSRQEGSHPGRIAGELGEGEWAPLASSAMASSAEAFPFLFVNLRL